MMQSAGQPIQPRGDDEAMTDRITGTITMEKGRDLIHEGDGSY